MIMAELALRARFEMREFNPRSGCQTVAHIARYGYTGDRVSGNDVCRPLGGLNALVLCYPTSGDVGFML